jgi:hypothetical protein
MRVSDDGTITGSVNYDSVSDAEGFIIHDGQTIELPEFEPMSALAQDSVAVVKDIIGDEEVGWIDLALNWYPVEFPPVHTFHVRVAEDEHTLEYVADFNGELAFLRVDRDGVEMMLPLPPEGEEGDILAAGNYRLVQGNNPAHVRIDVDLAEAVYVNPAPPQGWSFYICGGITINSDGALVYTLSDGVVAQTWTYDVDADAWSEVGKPYGLIQTLGFVPKTDNLLYVWGIGLPPDMLLPCSVPLEDAPPPEALLGNVAQLVDSSTGFQMDLDYAMVNHYAFIDGAQRCLALDTPQGWIVRPLDDSGVVIDFEDSWRWHWLD